MTSMPASRSARAITFAPRSWPSRPGFATNTRIFCSGVVVIYQPIVFVSRLLHKYQHAILRYGSQRLAIFSICSGVGSVIFTFGALAIVFLVFVLPVPFFFFARSR